MKNQLRYQIKRQKNNAALANPITSNTINPFLQHSADLSKPVNLPEPGGNKIFDMIREFANEEADVEDQGESDWVGFLTRNKQFRV